MITSNRSEAVRNHMQNLRINLKGEREKKERLTYIGETNLHYTEWWKREFKINS